MQNMVMKQKKNRRRIKEYEDRRWHRVCAKKRKNKKQNYNNNIYINFSDTFNSSSNSNIDDGDIWKETKFISKWSKSTI